MKTHLDHPTQTTACGTRCSAHAVEEKIFRLSTHNRCCSCARVLAAKDAGREVYSGAEYVLDCPGGGTGGGNG